MAKKKAFTGGSFVKINGYFFGRVRLHRVSSYFPACNKTLSCSMALMDILVN